jgi:hypothetical protein
LKKKPKKLIKERQTPHTRRAETAPKEKKKKESKKRGAKVGKYARGGAFFLRRFIYPCRLVHRPKFAALFCFLLGPTYFLKIF